jgi:chromosome segregation ATPase
VERLKQELSRAQKLALSSEQTSQIGKLKKRNDSLDAKLQESRKQNIVDQTEIKDLRAKLRMSENEQGHLALKSEESGDARKSLAALETKRMEELRECDKHIAELEKPFTNERRRNEALEDKLLESKGRTQQELNEARRTISNLQSEVAVAEEGVASARTGAGQREEELIARLESARAMVQQVAEEYGKLASSTVPKSSYDVVKQENRTLQLNVNRLQRKFAIADSEANEMVDLLKVSRDQSRALEHIFGGSWVDLDSNAAALSEALLTAGDTPFDEYIECESHVARIDLDESARRIEAISAQLSDVELFASWYKTLGRSLLYDYSLACTELSAAAEENQAHQTP